MSCNTCAKPFTLLRKEKGCPSCGFSYCSKCLDHKVFVPKLNAEAKVCAKCQRSSNSEKKTVVEPPDAYYKRIGATQSDSVHKPTTSTLSATSETDVEIANRLRKLKEDKVKQLTAEEEIAQRLQKIKGETPKTSDAELLERLAKLRGAPVSTLQSQPVVIKPDLRSEQEQADDLMKQYLEQVSVDTKYKDEFDGLINNMESRLGKLKGIDAAGGSGTSSKPVEMESEDEEETVKKIIEKAKAAAVLEDDELPSPTDDELPFCEICNEDATMRCLGCRYLFCKHCFLDHKDDDDGCNRYEPYTPKKGAQH
ncbi:FYVE zinc finger domain-containing protein [Phthorimaea operculella]|nr:FYVE zinc finger domain-containing protein [Phthorimaea operculella]